MYQWNFMWFVGKLTYNMMFKVVEGSYGLLSGNRDKHLQILSQFVLTQMKHIHIVLVLIHV